MFKEGTLAERGGWPTFFRRRGTGEGETNRTLGGDDVIYDDGLSEAQAFLALLRRASFLAARAALSMSTSFLLDQSSAHSVIDFSPSYL